MRRWREDRRTPPAIFGVYVGGAPDGEVDNYTDREGLRMQ